MKINRVENNIEEVRLMGMKINNVNKIEILTELDKKIKENKKLYISITNTEAMYIGSRDKNHFDYINKSYLSLCDGTGLVIAGRVSNIKIRKYHGPDFFYDILKNSQKFGWTHYFVGGKDGVGKSLKKKFQKKYRSLKILGYYSPPFRKQTKQEEEIMIKKINSFKPNFLWVSLGLPKQERWIEKHLKNLDVNFAIGVGAAFDFHNGNIKRAPVFYQKIGLEWLYRTIFERRLIVRVLSSFKFMTQAIIKNLFFKKNL